MKCYRSRCVDETENKWRSNHLHASQAIMDVFLEHSGSLAVDKCSDDAIETCVSISCFLTTAVIFFIDGDTFHSDGYNRYVGPAGIAAASTAENPDSQ